MKKKELGSLILNKNTSSISSFMSTNVLIKGRYF